MDLAGERNKNRIKSKVSLTMTINRGKRLYIQSYKRPLRSAVPSTVRVKLGRKKLLSEGQCKQAWTSSGGRDYITRLMICWWRIADLRQPCRPAGGLWAEPEDLSPGVQSTVGLWLLHAPPAVASHSFSLCSCEIKLFISTSRKQLLHRYMLY